MCTTLVSATMPLDDDAWKRLPYYAYYSEAGAPVYHNSPSAAPQRAPMNHQYQAAAPMYPNYGHSGYASYPPPPRTTGYFYPPPQPYHQLDHHQAHVEPNRASFPVPTRDMLIFDSDLDEMRMLQEMLLTPYPAEEEAKESHVAMLLAASQPEPTASAPTTPLSDISSCDSQRMSMASSTDDHRSPRSSIASYSRSTRTRSIPPSRICRVPDCTKGIRSRGLCKAHGGGRRCQTPGCTISDQGGGHCIAHGGGKRCTTPGCDKSAQFKGLCKVHGGSRRCRVTDCDKNGQIKGLCRHHYTQSVQHSQGDRSDHDESDH